MSKLSVREECVKIVAHNYLARFIGDIYGVATPNIVSMQEWNNDQMHEILVQSGELDSWDKELVEKFKRGESPRFALWAIMNDLCNMGHIKPGNYIIGVSW